MSGWPSTACARSRKRLGNGHAALGIALGILERADSDPLFARFRMDHMRVVCLSLNEPGPHEGTDRDQWVADAVHSGCRGTIKKRIGAFSGKVRMLMEAKDSSYRDHGGAFFEGLTCRSTITASIATLGGHSAAMPIEARFGFEVFDPDIRAVPRQD